MRISSSMGSVALGIGAVACMGLVGYRMVYGNDHGRMPRLEGGMRGQGRDRRRRKSRKGGEL